MTRRLHTRPLLLVASVALIGAAAPDATLTLPAEGRIVLAPLNLGIRLAPELAEGQEPVWQEMLRLLEEREPPPASLDRESSAALWAEVVASAPGSDADADVYAAYARFARRVAEQVTFDAIVFPSLVLRSAEVEGFRARWDGVGQTVEAPTIGTPVGLEASVMRVMGSGALPAASLHVAVLTPDGALRFEGAGGLALLQRLEYRSGSKGDELVVADRPAPFADADALHEGVRTAFERPLPASRAH